MALYHSAKGSVDYTIVGSPTIVDGVASGFSNSNYLEVVDTFNIQDNFHFHIDISNFTNTGSSQFIFGVRGTNSFGAYLGGTGTGMSAVFGNTYWTNLAPTLTVGSPFTVDFSGDGTTLTFTVKQGNNTKTSTKTIEDSGMDGSYNLKIGINASTQAFTSGYIDLKNTYITVNGQPWFGVCPIEVKKHQLMGPVGYTVVGSPTIVDGILTNITANNYLSVGTYSGDTPTSIEIGSSFKTSDTTVVANSVIGRLTGADTGIFWGNSAFPGKICFKHRVSYDNGTTWTAVESKSATLSLNTKYYVKFIISLAEQKLTGYVSTDNINWTSYVANFNSGAILEGLTSIAIGKIYGHNASPLPIYLDYTYIKVNGKLWFYQPQPTKYIQRNNQLVWADQKLNLSVPATVGLTSVGTPTISDGVVSDFSSGNYIQTAENFSFKNPLEICFTATTSSDVNTSQLFCSVGNGGSNRSFGITIESGGKMGVAYTLNGSSWVGWLPSSYVFEGNTKYNFLIQYVPSQYFTIKVKKSTETSWTTFTNSLSAPIYTSTNCPFIFGQNYQNKPFLGSIDLKETYIKMDDVMWFQYPQTVTYTKVGNPAMVDNVASKFSLTDYLHVGNPFKPSNLPWEIQTVFKLDYPGSRKNVALTNSTLADYVFPKLAVQTESNSTLGVQALLSSNGTSGNINASSVIVSYDYSKKGYINLKFVPTSSSSGDYILSFKQEGGSFTQIATYSNKSIIFQNQNDTAFTIGADIGAPSSWRSAFIGSIYLDETYFKINNQLWFYGKNYATQNIAPVPSGFAYGNNITPSIGYVDMRTQQFTAAPQGATIGRDE